MRGRFSPYHRLWLLAFVLMVVGCSPMRFIPEDDKLLEKVEVKADDRRISTATLNNYIRQRPNAKWFSLLKVPMRVYCISGTDTTCSINRFFQRIGEAPVVYDSLLAERSRNDMQAAVHNLGFLNGRVSVDEKPSKRRMNLVYEVEAGSRYMISEIHRIIDDPVLDDWIHRDSINSLLKVGEPFDVNVLDQERSRLTSFFQDHGYYYFNKSYIRFEADTTIGNHQVALILKIPLYQPQNQDTLIQHQCYQIGRVNYLIGVEPQTFQTKRSELDSLTYRDRHYFFHHKIPLSPSFLASKTEFEMGEVCDESNIQSTYSNISSLSAVMGTSIAMEKSAESQDCLDSYISIFPSKRHAVSAGVEGTNSAGDFGAAVNIGYQNRNLFRHSALFSIELRGAYEAITGLEGYTDQNYFEFSAEASLKFPEFAFPYLSKSFKRKVNAQSIASLMYDSQNRPEFHRRVLTAAWRYRWNRYHMKRQHRVDLIDLNYVFMPWISETFRREYLTDNGGRNAILRYNYEDLFIMKAGYSFQYTSVPPTMNNAIYGLNAYSVHCGIETAGNLLYGISHLFNAQYSRSLDSYTLFSIAYAQYVKFDFDLVKSIRVDERNSIAFHIALGTAFPYGNSDILPYEKRYFSGGANSVRGWSVRGLGPGCYTGSDGRIDFIRQTGDLKLDLSTEWRTHLFWKIDGAAFVDAGNIWTLRNYEEQPGGQFRFDTFWKQIAVAYGLGIRLNFGYFIMRLDGGMKAINPAYESGPDRYPIIHPRFGRDFQLHFAVGLPY